MPRSSSTYTTNALQGDDCMLDVHCSYVILCVLIHLLAFSLCCLLHASCCTHQARMACDVSTADVLACST